MRFEVLFDVVEAGYFFPGGPIFLPFAFCACAFMFKGAAVLFPDSPQVRFMPFFAIGLGTLSVFCIIGESIRTKRAYTALSERYLPAAMKLSKDMCAISAASAPPGRLSKVSTSAIGILATSSMVTCLILTVREARAALSLTACS